ncbi:MAG: leucine-rich repeat domain-containing protein, partial [Algicola sp.]|nr:leucine-rich repeat domain-containing protein [Algicola sp.]
MKEFELQAFLADLKQVDVQTCKITSENCFVLSESGEVTHLRMVNAAQGHIDFNQITQLTHLTHLNLSSNNLTALPESIKLLTKLQSLVLTDNPITRHIKNIEHSLEPQALISYLLEIQNEDTRPLNEAKILVVGDERVGKTSLINRILGNLHNPNQQSTLGIDIQKTAISNDIQVNIWDFAGQESLIKP